MLKLVPALVSALALATPALAQDFSYTLDSNDSSVALEATIALDFVGDLRGNFEAVKNPGGTRTVLGLFGDNGMNNRAGLDLALELSLDIDGAATGNFDVSVDPSTGAVSLTGLELDLVAPSSAAGLGLVFEFETFRTIAPNSLYIGGFPLPIPLGSLDISDIRVVQSGDGVGLATPSAADPAVFDVTVLVPVDLTFAAELGGLLGGLGGLGGDGRGPGGGATPVGPIPLALPLIFTLDSADCMSAVLGGATQTFDQSTPSPLPLDLTDLPFDLPTILPPGDAASLLFDISLDSLSFDGSFGVNLSATSLGGRFIDVCPGEPNSTGTGAEINALGTPSLLAGDIGFQVTNLPLQSFGMMVMSQVTDSVPGFGGSQGTLCLGEPCFRFVDSVQSSGAIGEIAFFPIPDSLPQGQSFVAGERWNFQYWYRDRNPSSTSNVSGAVGVFFCR